MLLPRMHTSVLYNVQQFIYYYNNSFRTYVISVLNLNVFVHSVYEAIAALRVHYV